MREEVLIDAGGVRAFSRVDAFRHDAVLSAHAEALVADLLALQAAADVEAEHADAEGLSERGPEIGGGGIAASFSAENSTPTFVDWMSTTGDSLVTRTVSSTVETSSARSTVRV